MICEHNLLNLVDQEAIPPPGFYMNTDIRDRQEHPCAEGPAQEAEVTSGIPARIRCGYRRHPDLRPMTPRCTSRVCSGAGHRKTKGDPVRQHLMGPPEGNSR